MDALPASELLVVARHGDPAAFEGLVARHPDIAKAPPGPVARLRPAVDEDRRFRDPVAQPIWLEPWPEVDPPASPATSTPARYLRRESVEPSFVAPVSGAVGMVEMVVRGSWLPACEGCKSG